MQLVLDANEYIFGLGLVKKESCESLLQFLADNISLHSISICRTIVEEVRAIKDIDLYPCLFLKVIQHIFKTCMIKTYQEILS